MKSDSIFKSLDAIATEGISRKKRTLFAKKVTIDLDEQHLIILDKRLNGRLPWMYAGRNLGSPGTPCR